MPKSIRFTQNLDGLTQDGVEDHYVLDLGTVHCRLDDAR